MHSVAARFGAGFGNPEAIMSKTFPKLPLILLLVLLAGCQPSSTEVVITPSEAYTPGPTPDLSNIAQNYPRVDGSTSTHPLQVLTACKLLYVECTWTTPSLLFSTERGIGPDLTANLTINGEIVLNIFHSGTHQAYVNLIQNNTDLILVARLPSEDELEQASQAGVTLDVHPIALDAFVFLAHKDNRVPSLALDQIQDIYSGKITDWSELGGTGEIRAYQRDQNSGSQELMEDLVMKGVPMVEAPDMILMSMMGPINAIHDDPLGIGYSVFYYATFMLPDENVKLLGVEGVTPTSETIASRAYPLVTEVYAVVRGDMPAGSPAVMLRDWFLTNAGQETIAESGYVRIR
jgi:phosphate transport system substrate-binding protein